MAATGDNVRAITGATLDDTALSPFLTSADCVMTSIEYCTGELTDACKDMAAAYLASHFLSLSAIGKEIRTIKRESFENYTQEYFLSMAKGQGILSTSYGQTANTLLNGCLHEVDKQPALVAFFG